MAELETIRVYIRYNELLAADLRAVIEGFERAYNQADCFVRGTRRVYSDDRLRVTSVQTGNSIEISFAGYLPTILTLASLTYGVLKTRETFWAGEKNKWDAKSAERKFHLEEGQGLVRRIERALREEQKNIIKAKNTLQKLDRQINRSRRIAQVETEFAPEKKRLLLETGKRKITLKEE